MEVQFSVVLIQGKTNTETIEEQIISDKSFKEKLAIQSVKLTLVMEDTDS